MADPGFKGFKKGELDDFSLSGFHVHGFFHPELGLIQAETFFPLMAFDEKAFPSHMNDIAVVYAEKIRGVCKYSFFHVFFCRNGQSKLSVFGDRVV